MFVCLFRSVVPSGKENPDKEVEEWVKELPVSPSADPPPGTSNPQPQPEPKIMTTPTKGQF